MTGRLLVLTGMLLFFSCARLPAIVPSAEPAAATAACAHVFPAGKWQLLHLIEADLPGGRRGVMTGLTILSSRLRSHRSVIMSVEGLVVFDAEVDRKLTIHRALPPFDAPGFAEGLMEDIRLIFFAPAGPPAECGTLGDGSAVCRYHDSGGGRVDIVSRAAGACEVRRYDRKQRLVRIVKIPVGLPDEGWMPKTLELTARGQQRYKLVMTLLEAVPLEP
ncbi:MAG: hypothetical protein WAM73_19075 [Desulfobacterales bacterium]